MKTIRAPAESAEAPESDRQGRSTATGEALAAGEPIAGQPGAIVAKAINLKIMLDPSRFLEASQTIGKRGFQLAIRTAELSLCAALNPKAVRKARTTVEEHGPPALRSYCKAS